MELQHLLISKPLLILKVALCWIYLLTFLSNVCIYGLYAYYDLLCPLLLGYDVKIYLKLNVVNLLLSKLSLEFPHWILLFKNNRVKNLR